MASKGVGNKGKAPLALLAVLIGALANSLASLANMALGSPLFFDSIFTAASGALFGPLAGCLCGLFTHGFLVAFHGWDLAWAYFLPCSLATGLIAGLFSRGGRALSLYGVLLCAALTSLANAVLGAGISAFAFGGITVHASDYLVTGLILAGQSMLSASFWARIPLNLIDKGIAVALAFILSSRPRVRSFFGLAPLPASASD